VRWTLGWFSTTRPREGLILCTSVTQCPHAPTSRNPFVRRSTMTCTPEQPHLLVAAHNFYRVEVTKKVMDAADINGASSVQRATGERISRNRDRGCRLPRSRSSSVLFCQLCSQHVATAIPCPPRRSPPRCSRLCRGRAPLRRSVQDAAKSQCSPAPPGRPRLRCMCVCVMGDVMFLCRSMFLLLSGWLSFAMRLLQHCFVRCFAYVLGFDFGCACGLSLAQPPSYAMCCVLSRSLCVCWEM
jgi:hypothetical protein